MANKIMIPTPLRPYTEKRDHVEVEGQTVGEMLMLTSARHETSPQSTHRKWGCSPEWRPPLRRSSKRPWL